LEGKETELKKVIDEIPFGKLQALAIWFC
jgi:hypothetical protein